MNTPDPYARTPYNTPLPGGPPPAPSAAPPTELEAPKAKTPTPTAAAPASAAAANGRPPTLTIAALAVAGLSLILGLIGVGIGVSAQARSAQLQQQVDQLEAQQDEVDGALSALDERTGTSLADYLEGLDARLTAAEATANGAYTRADEAVGLAEYVQDYALRTETRVAAVAACVNRYMETVGNSSGGYYRYIFC